jgi:hypothetical protein
LKDCSIIIGVMNQKGIIINAANKMQIIVAERFFDRIYLCTKL